MTSESLIRKYIASVLNEEAFIRNKSAWKNVRNKDVWRKILHTLTGSRIQGDHEVYDDRFLKKKKLFLGSEDSSPKTVAKNWLYKQSKKTDIPKDLKSKVYEFAEDNYENFLERAEGDADIAAGYLMSALTRKFLSP
jgi:hypothetical protein